VANDFLIWRGILSCAGIIIKMNARLKKIGICMTAMVVLLIAFTAYKWEVAHQNVALNVAAVKSKRSVSGGVGNAAPEATGLRSEFIGGAQKPRQNRFFSMPPPNVPLREIAGQLKSAADLGDSHASCRLATELARCQILPSRMQSLNSMRAKLSALSVESEEYSNLSNALARLTEKRQSDQIVCAGFENTYGLESWRYLFNAAIGGHVPSMAQFASMPPFNPANNFVGNMDAWVAYKLYANTFLITAANAGDKGAVWNLAEAYAGNSLFLNGGFGLNKIIDVDPYMAAVYAYASLSIPGEQSEMNGKNRLLKQLQKLLSQEQMTNAKANGDSLAATWDLKNSASQNARLDRSLPAAITRSFDKMCDE
jgi:hypothetical protein